ncbi:hypothetical protein EJ04DRAFT_193724 [Polyplosphaeria fusca]|uniref:TRAF-type domain-containing protein n=1 Tax=Polyplosphaeria fusca TaxID=682080 RepID=A0A9P4R2B9_9PLEO|nr:hypothetical protein EJ04DRAFT_193724 [Polyplosphaeria fusca]
MMKKDLEDHQRTDCPNRSMSCPHCLEELLRIDMKAHMKDVCNKVVVPCQGTIIGCNFTAERETVVEHEQTCPMATMAPHFREQQARIERGEARIEPLIRRMAVFEEGFDSIHRILYPANDAFPSAPLMPTPDFRLPPASFPPVPPSNDQSQTPFTNPSLPPFDSQVHHLLTLHDSLREETTRVANALTELEGRTNMMIINENQRVKDEMLHTNAAINSMRMQLHWLMSATLQQRSANSASSTGRAAGSTGANAGGSSTQGANLGGRAGPSATLHPPMRRLSDSTRQDVKL